MSKLKRSRWFWLGVLVFPLLGASQCKPTADTVELTLFHTNDMHSHFRGPKSDPFGLGGMARLSTLLKKLRGTRQASLTLDAGDYSEGTWYFAIDTGANMLRLMSKMGYDAAALGNHDFLMGPDQIIRTLKEAKPSFPVLAANLSTSAYPRAGEFNQVILPSTIREVAGLKVGIIGLTTFQLVFDSYMRPIQITNIVDSATRIAKIMRPKVDVLILLSHNAFSDNEFLAKAVPGVNAVISGHTHLKVPKAVMVKNAGRDVPVVETGTGGTFLGDLTLYVSPVNKVVQFKNYQLHPVSPEIAEDPEILSIVEKEDHLLSSRHGEDVHGVIANAEVELTRSDIYETTFGNLAVKAYREISGADLALEEAALTGISLKKGPATLMDIHDVVPHIYDPNTGKEWMLRVWNAKGSDLLLAMNVFYTIEGLMPMGSPLGWLLTENAQVLWDPGIGRIKLGKGIVPAPKLAVKNVWIGGKALDPRARYRVALSDGLLLAIRLANDMAKIGLDLSDIRDTGIEAWDAVVRYSKKVGTLSRNELRVGGRAYTQTADLAIFDYTMDRVGNALVVDVQNLGLNASQAATVVCSTGAVDNAVFWGTDQQKWTVVGSSSLPSLATGAVQRVQVRWTPARAGAWPVQCEVKSKGDGVVRNNLASKVFQAL